MHAETFLGGPSTAVSGSSADPGTSAPAAGSTARQQAAERRDLSECLQLMRGGSKSFFAASLLLPKRVKAPACALYAFCRLADDAVDLGDNPYRALDELSTRLDEIYAARPRNVPADRALAITVRRHGVPRLLLDALLEGFLWDAQGRRYETLDDLHDYAARVAGNVGVMMALVMGTRSPQALARAGELGAAMQLTNIARDVGEDARNGRLYLPRQWMREEGLDPEAWLERPVFSPALGRVVARLLDEAHRLYERAEHGIAELPRDCRPAIRAARLVYAEIGQQLQRAGLDSVSVRTVVPKQRKLALLAVASGAAVHVPRRGGPALVPLGAVRFLVEACPAQPREARRTLDDRLGWIIELSERRRLRELGVQ